MKNKKWYNIILTEFMDNEDNTSRIIKNQTTLAKVQSKGLAYIVYKEFKKIYYTNIDKEYYEYYNIEML